MLVSYVAGEGVELTVHKESVVVEEIKEVELRSRRAQYIYDRNYNRIGYIATQSSVFLLICTKQTSGEEVKTSVTQKEKTKGICMDHFLLFLRIHN